MHLLPKTLPDFTQASFLVVGDVMLDRYLSGNAQRLSPEAPIPIVAVSQDHHRLGGAGNVALNLASLGAPVTLMGLTGIDAAEQLLKQQLQQANIISTLLADPTTQTTVKLRVMSQHQQLLRLDFESPHSSIDLTPLYTAFKKQLPHAQCVILSDYNKGVLKDPQAFITLAKAARIPVLVDPKRHDFSCYQQATLITPNFKEFEAVVGTCATEEDIHAKGLALLKQHQFDALLITRGDAGMTLIEKHRTTHIPACTKEIFDVTGAGDTVISVMGLAISAGLDYLTAAMLANLAASLVVNKLGAATLTPVELQNALTGHTLPKGVVDEKQLLKVVGDVRAAGKKMVFTNGCFDILHAGHVQTLQLAKNLGDYLIVAVNTDHSVRQLKGERRPFNPLEQRMQVLAGLAAVDWVIPFSETTPNRLLQLIRPDILVKGGDYTIDQVVGKEIVQAYGGTVQIVSHTTPIRTSSSSLINQLLTERD